MFAWICITTLNASVCVCMCEANEFSRRWNKHTSSKNKTRFAKAAAAAEILIKQTTAQEHEKKKRNDNSLLWNRNTIDRIKSDTDD